MTSLGASDRVRLFGKLPIRKQQPYVLKEDALETKIFICYNALSIPLASRELRELCQTAGTLGESSKETGPAGGDQGSEVAGREFDATVRTPVLSLPGRPLTDATVVEKIPCLGKVDPRYLLKAFEAGCDAVCLVGCAVGKCHTMDGNLRAQRRVLLVRSLLEEIGLKGERVFLSLREPMDEQGVRELIGQFFIGARSFGPSEMKQPSGVNRNDGPA